MRSNTIQSQRWDAWFKELWLEIHLFLYVQNKGNREKYALAALRLWMVTQQDKVVGMLGILRSAAFLDLCLIGGWPQFESGRSAQEERVNEWHKRASTKVLGNSDHRWRLLPETFLELTAILAWRWIPTSEYLLSFIWLLFTKVLQVQLKKMGRGPSSDAE